VQTICPSATPAYNPILFERLWKKRQELAETSKVPPYIIFSDRTLVEMATYFPQSRTSFAIMFGVGQAKLEKYTNHFLPLIRDYCPAHHITATPKTAAATPSPQHLLPGRKSRTEEIAAAYSAGHAVLEVAQDQASNRRRCWSIYGRQPRRDDRYALKASSTSADSPRRTTACPGHLCRLGSRVSAAGSEACGETVSYNELKLIRLYFANAQ
jgi:ATP-dependent DNA helicase RecQ